MTIRLFPANDCSLWSLYATVSAVPVRERFIVPCPARLVPDNDVLAGVVPDFLGIITVIGPETNHLAENEGLYDLWVGIGPVKVEPGSPAAALRFAELLADLVTGLGGSVTVVSDTPRFWSYVQGRGGVVCRRIRVRID